MQNDIAEGITVATSQTTGMASSNNTLLNSLTYNSIVMFPNGGGPPIINVAPDPEVTSSGLAVGTSFGASQASSPTAGAASAIAGASGTGNSSSIVSGGLFQDIGQDSIVSGNGFGNFDAAGAAAGVFGQSPNTPTGGTGGGFGFTLGGANGNVTGDAALVDASGAATSVGSGTGQGQNVLGVAGGTGGAASTGQGGGTLQTIFTIEPPGDFVVFFSEESFNGTGGGLASGSSSGFLGAANIPTDIGAQLVTIPFGPSN